MHQKRRDWRNTLCKSDEFLWISSKNRRGCEKIDHKRHSFRKNPQKITETKMKSKKHGFEK